MMMMMMMMTTTTTMNMGVAKPFKLVKEPPSCSDENNFMQTRTTRNKLTVVDYGNDNNDSNNRYITYIKSIYIANKQTRSH